MNFIVGLPSVQSGNSQHIDQDNIFLIYYKLAREVICSRDYQIAWYAQGYSIR